MGDDSNSLAYFGGKRKQTFCGKKTFQKNMVSFVATKQTIFFVC